MFKKWTDKAWKNPHRLTKSVFSKLKKPYFFMTSSIENPLFFEASIMSSFWASLILVLFPGIMMLLKWDFLNTFCHNGNNWMAHLLFHWCVNLSLTNQLITDRKGATQIVNNNLLWGVSEQHFFMCTVKNIKSNKKISLLNWIFYYIEIL